MHMVQTENKMQLYSIFTGLFVATLIISNVLSSAKIIAIGPLTMPAGAILFPVSFIFGDILCEVYGFARSRKVIWIGFGALALASITFYIGQMLPGASFWNDQVTYERILGFVPRIVGASMIAYFAGEFCNSYVLSKMKYRARGKRGVSQASRFIMSTIVGEGVDSIVFMTIAFAGVLSPYNLFVTGGTLYVFKVVYEILATPFSTRLANWVKRYEGVDHLDTPSDTSYNPFAIFVSNNK